MKNHSAKKEDEKKTTNQLTRNYLKTLPRCSTSLSATSLRNIPSKKQPTMGTTPLFFDLLTPTGPFSPSLLG